jgi:hypothetical protein
MNFLPYDFYELPSLDVEENEGSPGISQFLQLGSKKDYEDQMEDSYSRDF